ncbi:hypothetical protein AVEN_229181-1 [Araneus ventricosus]|uniref:HTH CENPB-type domain-containing protein n=1 Tax=Araneus ventricosus TaxID=182803 RepID=A0A4Y2HLS2_ARAVE|nr:hypothetical protein AVEN_229181-1 [Araneus ventricosus]
MSKRVFLNLEQRIEVLRQYENGKSARKSSELSNCGRTQINKAIKEKDLIFKDYEDFKFRGVKRMRHKTYVDINEAVLEWFKTVRAKKIPVSGPMIQHKAKEFADPLGIENFSAPICGWTDFAYGITSPVYHCVAKRPMSTPVHVKVGRSVFHWFWLDMMTRIYSAWTRRHSFFALCPIIRRSQRLKNSEGEAYH